MTRDPSDNFLLLISAALLALLLAGCVSMIYEAKDRGIQEGYCEATCDVIGGENPMYRLDSKGACICTVKGQDWPAPTGK
jgi:hypothetical protein